MSAPLYSRRPFKGFPFFLYNNIFRIFYKIAIQMTNYIFLRIKSEDGGLISSDKQKWGHIGR